MKKCLFAEKENIDLNIHVDPSLFNWSWSYSYDIPLFPKKGKYIFLVAGFTSTYVIVSTSHFDSRPWRGVLNTTLRNKS